MARGKNSGHNCEFFELFSAQKCELLDNFCTVQKNKNSIVKKSHKCCFCDEIY